MSEGQRYPRAVGIGVARELCAALALFVVPGYLKVCGSLRRRKEEVGDVEIVFVPAVEEERDGLFDVKPVDLAAREIERLLGTGSHGVTSPTLSRTGSHGVTSPTLSRTGSHGVTSPTLSKRQAKVEPGMPARNAGWGPENKLAVHVATGMPVDLFATTIERWWMTMVIRTGSKAFNHRLIDAAAARGLRLHAYGEYSRDGTTVHCASERAVLELAGLPWLEPWERG